MFIRNFYYCSPPYKNIIIKPILTRIVERLVFKRVGFIFEYTHELAWKVLKDFLEYKHGIKILYGSKDTTKQAFKYGLIKNSEIWMNMIKSRKCAVSFSSFHLFYLTINDYLNVVLHMLVTNFIA